MAEFLSHLETRRSASYYVIGIQNDILYVTDDTPAKRWREFQPFYGVGVDERPNALRIICMDVYGSSKNWKTLVEIPFVGQTVCEHEERCRWLSSSIAVYGFSHCRKFIYALAYGREDNNKTTRAAFHLYKICIETGNFSSYKISLSNDTGSKTKNLKDHHICACCCGTTMVWTSNNHFILTRNKFADEEAFLTFLDPLPPHIMHSGDLNEEKLTFTLTCQIFMVPQKLQEDDWVFDLDDTRITLFADDYSRLLISTDEEDIGVWDLKTGTADIYKPTFSSDYDFSSDYANVYYVNGKLWVIAIIWCTRLDPALKTNQHYYALFELNLDDENHTYKCKLIRYKSCTKYIHRQDRTNFYNGEFFIEISPKTMKTVLLRMPSLAEWATYYLQPVHPETSGKFTHLFLAEHGVPRRSKRKRQPVARWDPSILTSKRRRLDSSTEDPGPSTSSATMRSPRNRASDEISLDDTHVLGNSSFLRIRI